MLGRPHMGLGKLGHPPCRLTLGVEGVIPGALFNSDYNPVSAMNTNNLRVSLKHISKFDG